MPFKKIRANDSQHLIGRADQLRFFVQEILKLDLPAYNIISISGQGGVGKSTLLNRYREDVHLPEFREYCLDAFVNERQTTPASVMERFADQFREQGYPLKKFEEALTRCKEALRRLQVAGYKDEQEALIREVVDMVGTVVEELPLAGGILHKGSQVLTDLILEKGRTHQFLKDVARMDDYIGDLTTAFVKDLNQLADTPVPIAGSWNKRSRHILLFFDTFEQLSTSIAPWLLDHFLDGDVSANIVLVIAGRESIESSLPDDPKRWLPLIDDGTIYLLNLKAFIEEETCLYLASRGITDPERISQIRQLSLGLPLYLSMLTMNQEGRIDPTAGVVENFLRWIPKHEVLKRQLALNASLFSLPFTKDDFAAFSYSEPERSELYRWIIGQPFVQNNPQDGRYVYHDLARDLFRRYLYQRSPEDYYTARKELIKFYQQRLSRFQIEGNKSIYISPSWKEISLALIQQVFLLSDEDSYLLGIEYVITAHEYWKQDDELIKILRSLFSQKQDQQMMANAQQLVETLVRYLEVSIKKQYQEQIQIVDFLLRYVASAPLFPRSSIACLYLQRARVNRFTNAYSSALADYNLALSFYPDYISAYGGRGETYRLMERYEEALADFDRVIALDEKDDRAIMSRGKVYQAMRRYEEALTDFDRAINVDERWNWAIALRGETYMQMGRYEEALADFDKAIELNDRSDWAVTLRGETYRQMGRYEEALADFDRAIELNIRPDWALWTIAHRGEIYRQMGKYEEALVDFNSSIALNEKYQWAIVNRGQAYRAMQRYEEALADFNRSIELNEKLDWSWYNRALIWLLMNQSEAFHQDLSHAALIARFNLEDNLGEDSAYYRLRFNIALYMLMDGQVEAAKNEYVLLISTCQIFAPFYGALKGLKDFLTIRTTCELAQQILILLQVRLKEFKSSLY